MKTKKMKREDNNNGIKNISAWCRGFFERGDLEEKVRLCITSYNNTESQLSAGGEAFGLADASSVVITREKGKSRSRGTIATPGFMK